MFINLIFMFFACILVLMISIYKLFIQKNKNFMKKAEYVTVIVWAFALYICSAVIFAFFIKGILNKIIIILFAISPFIIGKLATYKKEGFYSFVQILISFISAVFAYLKF